MLDLNYERQSFLQSSHQSDIPEERERKRKGGEGGGGEEETSAVVGSCVPRDVVFVSNA